MSSTTARSAGRLAWISAMTAIRMRAVSPRGPSAAIPPEGKLPYAPSGRRERGSTLAPPAMGRYWTRSDRAAAHRDWGSEHAHAAGHDARDLAERGRSARGLAAGILGRRDRHPGVAAGAHARL